MIKFLPCTYIPNRKNKLTNDKNHKTDQDDNRKNDKNIPSNSKYAYNNEST